MDVLLDLIELLHNEIVAEPIFVDREHTSDIEGSTRQPARRSSGTT